MTRLIDADALEKNLSNDLPYKSSVKRVLIQAPTVDDVEVVRHGKWNTFKSTVGDREMYAVRCSCCNEAPLSKPFQGWVESAYCPHCGAKMDGD